MSIFEDLLRAMPPHDPEAVPVEAAKAVLRNFVQPVGGSVRVHLRSALDRVLAEDVLSPIDVPGHDNSAMDGWALRSQDVARDGGGELRKVGTAYAGHPYAGEVGPGECVRIMTGAVVPRGADAVVVQEVVRAEGDRASVPPGARPGENIRRAGEDLGRGAVALARGTRVRPAEIGLLASLGIGEVPVCRRLRVAFFSTGDELRGFEGPAAGPLAAGELYDSNRYTLAAMLERLGCDIVDLGVVRDDPASIEQALVNAAAHDAVITTGGVAEGEADHTRRMMQRLAEVAFWKLALRPGRPFAFGRFRPETGPAYLFGLPGNPVAAMVAFYQFARPALLAMMGCAECEPPLVKAKTREALRKRPGRIEFQRGILECAAGDWSVRLTGPQGSGILSSMTRANCFVVLPSERGPVGAGEWVDVLLMDGLV